MDESEFTVKEFIEMLKQMPPDAKLYIEYDGYYEGSGGVEEPVIDRKGRVVIGSVDANY